MEQAKNWATQNYKFRMFFVIFDLLEDKHLNQSFTLYPKIVAIPPVTDNLAIKADITATTE
jgi:hypothetical protein